MTRTIHATFDGQVLRPEDSVDLEPNKRYLLTVEEDLQEAVENEQAAYPLRTLLGGASDLGVTDLAEAHDDYAHRG
jgi:hypothetical protein